MNDRIEKLRRKFDGLIRYSEMLMDFPDWTDEQIIEFAMKWHNVAVKQRKENPQMWNEGIPHCRNIWREDLANG